MNRLPLALAFSWLSCASGSPPEQPVRLHTVEDIFRVIDMGICEKFIDDTWVELREAMDSCDVMKFSKLIDRLKKDCKKSPEMVEALEKAREAFREKCLKSAVLFKAGDNSADLM